VLVPTFNVDLWLQDLFVKTARHLATDAVHRRVGHDNFFLGAEPSPPTLGDLSFRFSVSLPRPDTNEVEYDYAGNCRVPLSLVLADLNSEVGAFVSFDSADLSLDEPDKGVL
jgi:hypothetical protein